MYPIESSSQLPVARLPEDWELSVKLSHLSSSILGVLAITLTFEVGIREIVHGIFCDLITHAPQERRARVMAFGSVCLPVRARNKKTNAPIDSIFLHKK